MIDAKHLQLVLAVETFGSLSKAAQSLNVTPSALSHQLKNLESNLGLSIFHRIDNQLYFTEAGKEFKDRAKIILEEWQDLANRMDAIKSDQQARYIHGYSDREARRLVDQATSVADFLHHDSIWEAGSRILEIGCGVGAQTQIIAPQNPDCEFVSIDISSASLKLAQEGINQLRIQNVTLLERDAFTIDPRIDGTFDHVFICFLLEHVHQPKALLRQAKKMLKSGGTITVIEGDHGSTFFHPDHDAARQLVQAQVDLQQQKGGNANIGRMLFPLLAATDYQNIQVSPRQIYVDASMPHLVDGFIKNTFTAMIQGMSEELLQAKLVDPITLQAGIKGLLRTAESDGAFSYTFFKGKGSTT